MKQNHRNEVCCAGKQAVFSQSFLKAPAVSSSTCNHMHMYTHQWVKFIRCVMVYMWMWTVTYDKVSKQPRSAVAWANLRWATTVVFGTGVASEPATPGLWWGQTCSVPQSGKYDQKCTQNEIKYTCCVFLIAYLGPDILSVIYNIVSYYANFYVIISCILPL